MSPTGCGSASPRILHPFMQPSRAQFAHFMRRHTPDHHRRLATILSTVSTTAVSNSVLPSVGYSSSAILDTRHAAAPCSLPPQPCYAMPFDRLRECPATPTRCAPCPALPCPALPAPVTSLPRSRHGTWACPSCKVPSEAFAAGCGGTLGLRWPGSRPGRQARYRNNINSIPTPALAHAIDKTMHLHAAPPK
jgi:hypothetical protein